MDWIRAGLVEEIPALVPHWVAVMRDYLARRPEFAFGRWRPAVTFDFHSQRSHGGRWASGYSGVRLHLGGVLHRDGFREYQHIAGSPAIGSLHHTPMILSLLCLVAHEMAHAVQYAPVRHRYLDSKELRVAHGTGFRFIYRLLRETFVNPHVPGGAIGRNDAVPWDAVREVLPVRLAVVPDHGRRHFVIDDDATVRIAARRLRRRHDLLCARRPAFSLDDDASTLPRCAECWEIATNAIVRRGLYEADLSAVKHG